MSERRILCPVEDRVGDASARPTVNAFRIVDEAGDAYFLDFIHYSPADLRADVIHRVRLHGDMLESTRDRLAQDMVEVVSPEVSLVWPPMTSKLVN